MQRLFNLSVRPYTADARLLTDSPQKLLEDVSREQQVVISEIQKAVLAAKSEVVFLTPYFIPRKGGMDVIRESE